MNTVPSTVPASSRTPSHWLGQMPSTDTFARLSDFLRAGIADEESRVFTDSIGQLAARAEAVVAALRVSRHRDHVAPILMDMLTVLRDHRAQVVNLGLAWRGLYEYAGYLQALNNFRVVIGQWLLQGGPWDDQLEVTAGDFERVAWRTLGDGMLLVDMYEQWLHREDGDAASALGALEEPQLERARQWWHKLRR